MIEHVSLAQFEANLRRYYEDDLTRSQVKDLYRQWLKLCEEPMQVLGYERSFLPENNPAKGLAWAEERWAAHPDPGGHPDRTNPTPITVFDQINLFLTSELGVSPRPRPRVYRPGWLVGEWLFAEWVFDPEDDHVFTQEDLDSWYLPNGHREMRAAEEAAGLERQWILHADGRVETDADASGGRLHDVAGSTWRYHHASWDEIWFERKQVIARHDIWCITERAGDTMVIHPMGSMALSRRMRRAAVREPSDT